MRKCVTVAGGAGPHEHARFRHYEVCMPVPVVCGAQSCVED